MLRQWLARIGSAGPTRSTSHGSARVLDLVGEAQALAASDRDVAVPFPSAAVAADALTGAVAEPSAASASASPRLIPARPASRSEAWSLEPDEV